MSSCFDAKQQEHSTRKCTQQEEHVGDAEVIDMMETPTTQEDEEPASDCEQGSNNSQKSNETNKSALVLDLDRMKDTAFFLFPDLHQRLSRFWILILLASIIATNGLAGDSAATVIGAMIVAPLMTPIMGTMLAIVLVDRRNFFFSLFLVLSGAASAVLVGYIFGLFMDEDVITKENNSQIAARVSPRVTDLLGALATGAVGSIALVRKDIADTVPGVAISISLVPPLCVAGLAFSTGDFADAVGALILFMTNFLSILVVGVIVMVIYKVHLYSTHRRSPHYRRTAFCFLALMLGSVGYVLVRTSLTLHKQREIEHCLRGKVDAWANENNWETLIVVAREEISGEFSALIQLTGPPPIPLVPEEAKDIDIVVCGVDDIEINYIPVGAIHV